jgi:hypothetical protein
MKAALLLVFCLLSVIGCSEQVGLREDPYLLRDQGINLGSTKNDVVKKLGSPQSELNFSKGGHQFSVAAYDWQELYYHPAYEWDDVGILRPQPGVQTSSRPAYRLTYMDDRLYSIEDFARNRYTMLRDDKENDFVPVLQELQQRQ